MAALALLLRQNPTHSSRSTDKNPPRRGSGRKVLNCYFRASEMSFSIVSLMFFTYLAAPLIA